MESRLSIFLISLFFVLNFGELRAGGVIDAQSRELAMLSNYVRAKIEKTSSVPASWRDLWDEQELVDIFTKTFTDPQVLSEYLFERYWFTKGSAVMPSPYQGSAVSGEIILVKKTPSNFDERTDATGKSGLWWEFIWITSDKKVRLGKLPYESLNVGGNGIQLQQPDIPAEWVASFQEKLRAIGAQLPRDKQEVGSVPARSDAREAGPSEAAMPQDETPSVKATPTSESPQPESLSTVPWLIGIALIAAIILGAVVMRRKA